MELCETLIYFTTKLCGLRNESAAAQPEEKSTPASDTDR